MRKHFDYQTIILIVICALILAALVVLIGVVLRLYFKVVNALDAARIVKETNGAVSCIYPCKVSHENILQAKPIPMESCRTLQCCDACSVYTDVGALPPCICSVSEGL
ncbi:protein FAM24A-like [Microtus ochrogaster]|uniref:Protein FAM24A-like n=1 Tax=Microtus ochrogaster TaxID=79684 RepID=A0ABM0KRK4_MICOH|nr:protein FAM24A-like [Microtus ochrogaster]